MTFGVRNRGSGKDFDTGFLAGIAAAALAFAVLFAIYYCLA